MPRGGARAGAGRKPGSGTSKRAAAEARRILDTAGITPLGYMQGILDGTIAYDPLKAWAAEKAAPYIHPRLAAVEMKGEMTVKNVARLPEPAETAQEWSRGNLRPSTH